MATIGETLREARMRQQLDIADVEARTKIRAKYLRALENEEFGMLPGPTFVKTFLRTYAEVLGLDPFRLVEEYRSYYERREDAEPVQTFAPPTRGRSDRRRRPTAPPLGPLGALLLLALVVVGALAAVGVLFGGDGDEGGEAADDQTTQTTRASASARARPAGAAPAGAGADRAGHAHLRVHRPRRRHPHRLRGHVGVGARPSGAGSSG